MTEIALVEVTITAPDPDWLTDLCHQRFDARLPIRSRPRALRLHNTGTIRDLERSCRQERPPRS